MTRATWTPAGQKEWKAARNRLLSGYAPLTIFILALVLVTLLIPSVAPDKNVVTVREGLTSAQKGTATPGANTASTTTPSTPSSPGSTGSATTTPGQAGGVVSGAPTGGGAAVTGNTTKCPGRALQVSGDPYSPPCIGFTGNNGGTTSSGVSASTITLSFRIPADFASLNQSVGSLGGAQFTASVAEVESTVQGLVTYFNDHFQFYGRKLKVAFFNGQGSVTNEVQGEGQAQATADATTVAQQIHAFADMDTQTPMYSEALSQQHVLNIGQTDSSEKEMEQLAPYAWGPGTTCDTLVSETMEVVDNELATALLPMPVVLSRVNHESSPSSLPTIRTIRSVPMKR